ETAYYLRLCAQDKPGVLSDVTRILAEREISIEAILQKEPVEGATRVPVIILTHRVTEGAMNEAIAAIEALEHIEDKVTRIRLEHLDAS
ncbi:MAG: homoserine dehydrogenase, partial [Gammaproteobacteria bacterium]|nr:homoserine dehydrogenase [Gammaproteobacteria bacterium]